MVWLSDLALVLVAAGLNALAVYGWRARRRNGPVLLRLAEFLVALAVFINFFTVVYWDRRWNVWPWADLHKVMGFEWYWVPRLMLFGATTSLLIALMRTPKR